nr:hypothetical protein [Brucella intermedia]
MDVIEMTIAPESSITVAHGNLVDGNTSLGCMTEWTGATRIASGANIDFSAYGGGIRNLQDATPGNGGTVSWATRPLRLYGAVFSGQFVNSAGGELIKGSLDTLLLNGDSSGFTGTTTVAGGELIVGDTNNSNARLGGTISILSGATLGGYGSVGETTVLAGGVLSPGNSIGTLTVDGSLQLASGSTLGVEIAGNGYDIRRYGCRHSHGPKASYQNGQNYIILHADQGVSGAFDTITSRSAFLNLKALYSANDVHLNIAIKADPTVPVDPETPTPGTPGVPDPGTSEPQKPSPALFKTVAHTRNQYATAGGLDTLAQTGSSLALYNTLLMLSAD